MPECGSQVVLCDLPIRADTYRGCSHGCEYCFAAAKGTPRSNVRPGESVLAIGRFIEGNRSQETLWCDWRIPLHIGGLSDPFQPAERKQRRTLAVLELLAARRYPFVISTKATLPVESPWREALSRCNCVVQVSMVSPQYDEIEPAAPPFADRLAMLPDLAAIVPRVVVRVQPYRPDARGDVLRMLPRLAKAGVHGVTVEGWKYRRAAPDLVKVGSEWCHPADVLERDFLKIRDRCHALGLAFYSAENRLRRLSDDRCCCGTAGLPGFTPNTANLNSPALGRPLRYRRRMQQPGTAAAFRSLCQSPVSSVALPRLSFAECMQIAREVPGYRESIGIPTRPGGRSNATRSRIDRPSSTARQPRPRAGLPETVPIPK